MNIPVKQIVFLSTGLSFEVFYILIKKNVLKDSSFPLVQFNVQIVMVPIDEIN